MSNIPSLILNTNDRMPLLGLGVYKATAPGEVEGAIAAALDCGYRLIDTASAYKMKRAWDVASALLLFRGRNFSSRRSYGIPHSGSVISTALFRGVWIGSDLITWIFT